MSNTFLYRCMKICHVSVDVHVVTMGAGAARIRVQISATHSQSDLDQCISAFIEIGKQRGVIP